MRKFSLKKQERKLIAIKDKREQLNVAEKWNNLILNETKVEIIPSKNELHLLHLWILYVLSHQVAKAIEIATTIPKKNPKIKHLSSISVKIYWFGERQNVENVISVMYVFLMRFENTVVEPMSQKHNRKKIGKIEKEIKTQNDSVLYEKAIWWACVCARQWAHVEHTQSTITSSRIQLASIV